jgi:hypothetical protein
MVMSRCIGVCVGAYGCIDAYGYVWVHMGVYGCV